MSEELIIRHCSPTLAGLKTGNIFNCQYSSKKELYESLRALNKKLNKKGLRILPLRISEAGAMIYVYRPKKLECDLCHADAKPILNKNGYSSESAEKCIAKLRGKLTERGNFPHEIGLFLGYPPEDVLGFIDNGAKGSKAVGCWKVYGDVDRAEKLFSQYKKCTDVYMRCYERGRNIERLAVTD